VSFLAWAVFAAWSFAAIACGAVVALAVASLLLTPIMSAEEQRATDFSPEAAVLSVVGFAFSLERVAALWPW
jgi:hypothetical protein